MNGGLGLGVGLGLGKAARAAAAALARSILALALVLAIALPARAQRAPVWVYLRPEAVQSGKVVTGLRERAALQNDRAIPASLIRRIAATGAHIRTTSRWLQAVSVEADASQLAKLHQMKEVRALAPVGKLFSQTRALIPTPTSPAPSLLPTPTPTPTPAPAPGAAVDFDSTYYGYLWRGIKMLGVQTSHALGFTGKGVRVAILDCGFNPTHQALATRRVAATKDLINGDANVRDQPGDFIVPGAQDQEFHGTLTWSILGGYDPGKLVGPAFDATFILAKVDVEQPSGQDDFKADEDRWVAAVEWADSMGARVISSSLAYKTFKDSTSYTTAELNGDVTASARMADEAARRGILIVNAMGNYGINGQTSLWTPADADSIISVGAVDSLGNVAGFSGRGPTADGRLKPEVSALGVNVPGADYRTTNGYNFNSGTSLATPFIAGAAAMFMQAWPNLTIMAVRQALMLAGSRAAFPNFDVGYGVPDVSSAILFPEGITATVTGLNLENTQLTTIQPTFAWSAPLKNTQMGPVRYRLEISSDASFSNIIYSDTVTDRFSITVTKPLRPALARWYRIVAQLAVPPLVGPNITRISTATAPFAVPDWVKLLSLNGATPTQTDSVRPVFRWEPLAAPSPSGPLSYDVEILNPSTGALVVAMRNLNTASVQPPDPLLANRNYTWRVIAKSPTGVADTVAAPSTFLVTSDQAPPTTLLYQNFPNPFPNPGLGETSTHVWFDVTTRTKVELAVYDMRGHLIQQLIPNASSCSNVVLDPGQYGRVADAIPCVSTSWDGHDTSGSVVPRGVYILRLRAGGVDQVKKILFTP